MEFKPFIQVWPELVVIAGQWWVLCVFEGWGAHRPVSQAWAGRWEHQITYTECKVTSHSPLLALSAQIQTQNGH